MTFTERLHLLPVRELADSSNCPATQWRVVDQTDSLICSHPGVRGPASGRRLKQQFTAVISIGF